MRRKLMIGIALLGVFSQVNAQTLQGLVTDAETGEPLIGATIFIPRLQLGAATDDRGRYEVILGQTGTFRVVFSFVGYQGESRTVTVSSDMMIQDIALRHTTLETPSITITAKAYASDILSTPQAVVVLEGRELAHRRGATAFEALEGVAGLRLLRTGPGIAKPVIRGLSSQRILVIQNGIRQEGQQWGDEHAPELDAFGVDRIEIVKGPGSLLYGSDAMGGVIHATSVDLFDYNGPLKTQAVIQGLSNTGQTAANVRLGGRAGQTVYDGALTVRRAGSYRTPDGVVPNTGLTELNGMLRLGRGFSWGTVTAEYQHFGATIGLFEPGQKAGERFKIDLPKQRVSHDRAKVHLKTRVGANRLEWVTTWQQNRRREFEEEEAQQKLVTRSEILGTTEGRELPTLSLRLSTLTSDLRFHHRPVGRLFGTIAVSGLFQKNETLAEEALIPGARTLNGGFYVFEELMLPRVTISGGVRFDARRLEVEANEALGVTSQTRSYNALSGAIGLAWQPLSGLSLSVNAGRAWRAPVLIELFGNGVHEGAIRFERGDASLRPEQSLTLEGTIRWLRTHAYVEVTAFVNQINHYIFPRRTSQIDPGSGFPIYRFQQAEARLSGGELRIDYHPHVAEWLHFHVSGDAIWTRNLTTNDPLPWSPAPRLTVEVEVERGRLGAAEDVTFRLGPSFTRRQTRIDPSETRTPGYTLWDSSVAARFEKGEVTLTPLLAVANLFDVRYISHLSRFKPFDVPNYGRNIRFEVRVDF